jgi:hypothetical protein
MEKEIERIFVKPKEGLIVRHPEKVSHTLAPEGEWVVNSNQWKRYIKSGDVVISTAPSKEKTEKTSHAPKNDKSVKGGAQ